MKFKIKTLLIVLSAVLLATASVLGTLAYLTSTDEATNTFTVGNVTIKLDETKVNTDGTAAVPAARVQGNIYHLLPGHEYIKDPTVTVLQGSEKCYVRMLVTINRQGDIDGIDALHGKMLEIFDGYVAAKWPLLNTDPAIVGDTRTYEFRYFEPVDARTIEKVLPALFAKIKVPGDIDNAELASLVSGVNPLKIEIVAQAIQADGIVQGAYPSIEAAAWAAFDAS